MHDKWNKERMIEDLRARGYPTNNEELQEFGRLEEGTPNAADLYIRAFDAYSMPTSAEKRNLSFPGPSGLPKPVEPLPVAARNAMESFLCRNAETLELLNQAGQIENCRFECAMAEVGGPMFPYLSEIKNCAQLLQLYVVLCSDTTHTGKACRGVHDLFRLGESLKRVPTVIVYMARVALSELACSTVQYLLNQSLLANEELSDLQKDIHQIRNEMRMDYALNGERCFHLGMMQMIPDSEISELPPKMAEALDRQFSRILNLLEQFTAAIQLTPEKRFAEYRRIGKEMRRPVSSELDYSLPALDRSGMIELRAIAQLDCARAALGVERLRLVEGRLPKSLEEVVPKLIEAVPIDPFDEKPLRYKRLEKGYTIYSIGEDGEDNGGLPRDKVPKGTNFDWPFTVEH